MHVDILCVWVLRIASCFTIGENLIWRFFTSRQTAKLKSSPNFPALRYYLRYRYNIEL